MIFIFNWSSFFDHIKSSFIGVKNLMVIKNLDADKI